MSIHAYVLRTATIPSVDANERRLSEVCRVRRPIAVRRERPSRVIPALALWCVPMTRNTGPLEPIFSEVRDARPHDRPPRPSLKRAAVP